MTDQQAEPRQWRSFNTHEIVIAFARLGVSIATISRAIVMPEAQVTVMCSRAKEAGELAIMPPASSDDKRSPSLIELVNLRDEVQSLRYRIKELETADAALRDDFAGVAGLTRSEASLVSALVRRGRATKQHLYDARYGLALDADTPEPKIIDVFICKIRKKLAPRGIAIDTLWGVGYALTPENAQKIRDLAADRYRPYSPLPYAGSPVLAPADAN